MVQENKMDNVLMKKIVTAMMNMEILFWKILKQKHMAYAKDGELKFETFFSR